MSIPFSTSTDHLLAEIARIDLLIQMQLARARRANAADNAFQGLVITEQEIDALLASPFGLPAWALAAEPWRPEQVEAALANMAASISQRKVASAQQGRVLRLERIAELFGLTPFDVDVLLISLAPEIDLRYQRLYAYLQDDVTRRHPSVDLALNLLSPTLVAKLDARQRFSPTAPLRKHRLLHLFEDPAQPPPPLLGMYLKVDERITEYLLGADSMDERLQSFCDVITPQARLEEVLLPEQTKRNLVRLIRENLTDRRGLTLHFQGPPGVGKQTTAEALCREMGLNLLVVKSGQLLAAEEVRSVDAVQLVGREALLQGAALYWQDWDELLPATIGAENGRGRSGELTARLVSLNSHSPLIFLAGTALWEPVSHELGTSFVRVEFALPSYNERLHLWRRALNGSAPPAEEFEIAALAGKFRLSGGQIRDAVATARNLARWRNPDGGRVTSADLHAASRTHSNQNLSSLARKITPHYTWDDIILPEDRLEMLHEICNQVKHRARVYDEWGFSRKLALGKGLNVLFSGSSGTGKTMAAEVIANELGLDLYKIDLSTVISKYIGETEKNLARIFAEAETSNAILFFDEADTLFGKRSEVRDSHDRYANIEIGYLLQRMEEYEGVVILATNLQKNMDDAFVRRMHFSISFPFPDAAHRLRIWEKAWPLEAPRSADLDLDSLARRFELAGGNIKNVALAAAFLAADDGQVISMSHLARATRREFQKMGKLISESDFR